jgi:hypothetical protein
MNSVEQAIQMRMHAIMESDAEKKRQAEVEQKAINEILDAIDACLTSLEVYAPELDALKERTLSGFKLKENMRFRASLEIAVENGGVYFKGGFRALRKKLPNPVTDPENFTAELVNALPESFMKEYFDMGAA